VSQDAGSGERGAGSTGNRTCATCRWWSPLVQIARNGEPLGECRHRAPRVFQTERAGRPLVTRWPQTKNVDWCGNNLPRPVAARTEGGAS
jgi:hypothetical protein